MKLEVELPIVTALAICVSIALIMAVAVICLVDGPEVATKVLLHTAIVGWLIFMAGGIACGLLLGLLMLLKRL